ncbi:MAG: AAA family ATPase [Candidatus Hydrogenedentes bacterium]|nr:AAA family ATPase [Candidatus Hydrogenedentota bacterium]
MQVTRVQVSGFKSLANFELELAPFTCLIGMNGCGKSTVLQFFDFISHVLAGDVEKWFEAREWEPGDVAGPGCSEIQFEIHFSDGASWSGVYAVEQQRCVEENIGAGAISGSSKNSFATLPLIEEGGKLENISVSTRRLAYRGSVTNAFKDEGLAEDIRVLKHFLRATRVFDALSPQNLRRRDRQSRDSIGHGGEHLATYLDSLPRGALEDMVAELKNLYPHLEKLTVQNLPGGWKELLLLEAYDPASHLHTRSRHINDGLLRFIAILAELRSQHRFLLFDEIENGINAEFVEGLIGQLVSAQPQVMVTTHSPMILNYLEDEIARKSVVFLYKGPDGGTRAKRFFDIPSIGQKLEVMGPGEAFVDTNLVSLAEELNAAVAGA